MCFVRARSGDAIVLTTYGRSSGFCVDPIEKKPLDHFLPGSSVLSFGTAGCNLACRFCQNWDISKSREIDTLADAASPEALAEAAVRLGCRSVAFTYNDPVIFMEYANDVADACHERGIRAVAVTAGYMNPEPRADFYRHMDAANVDLKGFTERFYAELSAAHLQPVLDTLRYLRHETDVWFEITNLMIPGWNDSEAETDAMTRWIVAELGPDVPVHFTAFHPDYKMLDTPPTPPATLRRAREIAMANGVRYAYTGNVYDRDGQSTYCHGCGALVIERDWYELGAYRLTDDGRCLACGTRIPGVFAGPAEAWGRRRMPVVLAGA
jgi:pyruvate formate lyase activating enzyme